MTWQRSFKPTIDEAVSHTELKMKRLLPEEHIWQCRSELLEDGLPGSKRASARRYSSRPSLLNPELLWQNLSLHFGKPTIRAQFIKAQKWRRAYGICLVPAELLVSKLFPSALLHAREILAPAGWWGESSPPPLPDGRQGCAAQGRSTLQGRGNPPSPVGHLAPSDPTHLSGNFTDPLWRGQLKNGLLS